MTTSNGWSGEVSGGDDLMPNFIDQDAATLKEILDTIGQKCTSLSQRIIKGAGARRIYLSVQSIQDAILKSIKVLMLNLNSMS